MTRFSFIIFAGLVIGTQAYAEDVLPPQIVHEPCDEFKQGENFDVVARFYDDSPLFDPKVIYRAAGEGTWRNLSMQLVPGSEDYRATIPVQELKGRPFEYFIEVFDENGNGPARYGSPEAAIVLHPSASPAACRQVPQLTSARTTQPSSPSAQASSSTSGSGLDLTQPGPEPAKTGCDSDDAPLYCAPLFWGIVGVAVLGGVGAAVYFLAFADNDNGGPQVPRELFDIRVTAPDPTALRFGGTW